MRQAGRHIYGHMPMNTIMKVIIFTDGAARGNPDGPGGYGAIIRIKNAEGKILEKELSGGYPHTTNNRMELMGVIAALEEIGRLGEPCQGLIYSDSRYVVDAFEKHWITNWKKNGWVTASKTPVKNQDLWTRLLDAIAPHKISFRWVKGHDDHPENERCDKLATSAADKVGWSLDDSAEPFSLSSDWFEPGAGNASASADAAGDTYVTSSASETGKKEVAAAALSRPMKKQLSTSASSGTGKKELTASVSSETGSYHHSEAGPAQKIRIRYLSDKIEKLQPPTNSANWIDLRAAEDVELKKGDFRLISLGVAMKLPEGYEAHIVPRSSTYKNFGIIQANHHGVVDNAYCGDGDLWRMPVIAMRDTQIHINDRICQFRIERRQPDIIFEEVDHLESEDRGGFGSTGVQ